MPAIGLLSVRKGKRCQVSPYRMDADKRGLETCFYFIRVHQCLPVVLYFSMYKKELQELFLRVGNFAICDSELAGQIKSHGRHVRGFFGLSWGKNCGC